MHIQFLARVTAKQLIVASLLLAGLTSAHAAVRNRLPQITGSPSSVAQVGVPYLFQPSASDADGDPLRFKIQGQPRWASFNTLTGTLSGTPATANVGTYSGIIISVTDGRRSSKWVSLPKFSISVSAAANQPPTISGSPASSVTAGQAYSFQPSASDPDGNTLTFSIANKPTWASFSSATGRLSGTPGAGDVATYSNIVISVSDGKLSASLGAFSIVVMNSASGSVALSWKPPTTNADGTPLVDLAGFRVVYGQVSRQYTGMIDLPSPGLTSVVIENLVPATWYFAVKAYSKTGTESALSNEGSKTIK